MAHTHMCVHTHTHLKTLPAEQSALLCMCGLTVSPKDTKNLVMKHDSFAVGRAKLDAVSIL